MNPPLVPAPRHFPRTIIKHDASNVTMNILESQVTDLNYLAESPIAISGGMDGQRQSSSAESPGAAAPNGGMKRHADDATSSIAPQTRAKRNRYISIAW